MTCLSFSRAVALIVVWAATTVQLNSQETDHRVDNPGRELLANSLQAMNAPRDLAELEVLDISWEGTRNWGATLSPSPRGPFPRTTAGFHVGYDFVRNEALSVNVIEYNGYPRQSFRQFRVNQENHNVWDQGHGAGMIIPADPNFGSDPFKIVGLNFLPAFITSVLESEESEVVLESEGRWSGDLLVVRVTRAGRPPFKFFLDPTTHLVHKMVRPNGRVEPLQGDVSVTDHFENYRRVGALLLPTRWRREIGGQETLVMSGRYRFGVPMDRADFSLPDDYHRGTGPAAPGVLESLGEGVHLLSLLGNLNMVFVEFDDFLVAIGAPFNSERVVTALDQIADAIDKPVRLVGLTANWWDASGGVREFIARGIPIIAAPGWVEYTKRMAQANYGRFADRQQEERRLPEFRVVDGWETIQDGEQELVIIPVTGNPASTESLFFYLPAEKIIVSNFGFEPAFRDGMQPASDATVSFVAEVQRLGLVVETLVHFNGGVASWDEALESVRARRAWENR